MFALRLGERGICRVCADKRSASAPPLFCFVPSLRVDGCGLVVEGSPGRGRPGSLPWRRLCSASCLRASVPNPLRERTRRVVEGTRGGGPPGLLPQRRLCSASCLRAALTDAIWWSKAARAEDGRARSLCAASVLLRASVPPSA